MPVTHLPPLANQAAARRRLLSWTTIARVWSGWNTCNRTRRQSPNKAQFLLLVRTCRPCIRSPVPTRH